MFKRAWIAGIAFGLIFSVWEAKAQPAPEVTTDSPSTEKVRQHTADEINDGVTRFSIPVEIVEDPLEKKRAKLREDYSDQRERDDLAAQESMAESTEQIITVSWWQLGLTTAGTIAVFLSIYAAFKANKITREIGQAQVRAYLAIRITPPDIFNGQTDFKFKIENTGQSPATNVRYIAGIEMLDHPLLPTQSDFVHFDPRDRIPINTIPANGHIDASAHIDPPLTRNDIDTAKRNGDRRPYLIVRAFYTDVFREKGVVHETKLCAYTDISPVVAPDGSTAWKAEWELSDILNDAT